MVRGGAISSRSVMIAAVCAAIVLGGVAGWLIGSNQEPTNAEIAEAQAASYKPAFAAAQKTSFNSQRAKSKSVGLKRGAAAGARRGARRGKQAGQTEQARLDAATAAAVEKARPTTGYYGGCSVPLFEDGYCPSPEEIQQEAEAEAEGGY